MKNMKLYLAAAILVAGMGVVLLSGRNLFSGNAEQEGEANGGNRGMKDVSADGRGQAASDSPFTGASRLAAVLTDEYDIHDIESPKAMRLYAHSRDPHVDAARGLWVKGWDRTREDTAWLELRFVKPGKKGKMIPCRVHTCLIRGEWKGDDVTPRFDGNLNGDFDLTRLKDYAHKVGATIPYATAFRFPIARDWARVADGDFAGLGMGRTYFMDFHHLGYSSAKTPAEERALKGRAMIRVPEDVKPGQVAVMEVDVSQYFRRWWLYDEVKRTDIEIVLEGELAQRASSLLLRHRTNTTSKSVAVDGQRQVTVSIEEDELGGELIAATPEIDDAGYALCYKREISGGRVELPDDADVVVQDKDLVRFNLRLNPDQLKHVQGQLRAQPSRPRPWTSALGLLIERDDVLMVSGRELVEQEIPTSVKLAFIPGTYYVVYRDGKAGRQQVIGKVTITKADAGKTLQVQPLDD